MLVQLGDGEKKLHDGYPPRSLEHFSDNHTSNTNFDLANFQPSVSIRSLAHDVLFSVEVKKRPLSVLSASCIFREETSPSTPCLVEVREHDAAAVVPPGCIRLYFLYLVWRILKQRKAAPICRVNSTLLQASSRCDGQHNAYVNGAVHDVYCARAGGRWT